MVNGGGDHAGMPKRGRGLGRERDTAAGEAAWAAPRRDGDHDEHESIAQRRVHGDVAGSPGPARGTHRFPDDV
jgi:hypothetical protein